MSDPHKYTLGQASKATGKGKTTIQRAISKGIVSAEKTEKGQYRIDPSELHRVFPMKHSETVSGTSYKDTKGPHGDPMELAVRIKGLEEMLIREREALDELRADRDAWKQQARALLSGPPKTRRWWPW